MDRIACIRIRDWAALCAVVPRPRLGRPQVRPLLAPASERAALQQHQARAYSAVGQQHVANLVVFKPYAAKAATLAAAAAAVWLAYDPRAVYLTRRLRGAVIDVYG